MLKKKLANLRGKLLNVQTPRRPVAEIRNEKINQSEEFFALAGKCSRLPDHGAGDLPEIPSY